MSNQKIFEFDDPIQYLEKAKLQRSGNESNPKRLSAAQWARRLGYRSRRSMGMVLSRKRLPSDDMLERISEYLNHSIQEHRYLQLLFQERRLDLTPEELGKKQAQRIALRKTARKNTSTLCQIKLQAPHSKELLMELLSDQLSQAVIGEGDQLLISVQKIVGEPLST